MAWKENKILEKMPAVPSFLSEDGKKHFRWIVPLLISDHVLKVSDIPLISAACDFYARYLKAEDLDERKKSILMYEKIMSAYGVTFKARATLKLDTLETDDEESLNLEDFICG